MMQICAECAVNMDSKNYRESPDAGYIKVLKLGTTIAVLAVGSLFAYFQNNYENEFSTAVVKSCVALMFAAILIWIDRKNWRMREKAERDGFPKLEQHTKFSYMFSIAMGLILCAGGDFCLAMEHHKEVGNELWFIIGLVIFLSGHLSFHYGMEKRINDLNVKPGKMYMEKTALIIIIVLMLVHIISAMIQENQLFVLMGGVIVYSVVIARMALTALQLQHVERKIYGKMAIDINKLSKGDRQNTRGQFLLRQALLFDGSTALGFKEYVIGAFIFVLSDSVLAWGLFVDHVDRWPLVMITYYMALTFFTFSALTKHPCLQCVSLAYFDVDNKTTKKKK